MIACVSGIDTGVGKTWVTAALAGAFLRRGLSATTMKLVQTGCTGISEDIVEHRRLMGLELSTWDREGATCPYVLPYPASPHLAAAREGVTIDEGRLAQAALRLESHFGRVICEGAGGLMVPLSPHRTLLDFVADRRWPVVLVTCSRLGSLNHTLLSLAALQAANLPIVMVYLTRPQDDAVIAADSARFLQDRFPEVPFFQPEWEHPASLSEEIVDILSRFFSETPAAP